MTIIRQWRFATLALQFFAGAVLAQTPVPDDDDFLLLMLPAILGSAPKLESSANPAQYGSPLTFTVTIRGSNASGTVTFNDGGAPLPACSGLPVPGGNASVRSVSCPVSLGVGNHTIVVSYLRNGASRAINSRKLVQIVNPYPSSTTLSSSAPIANVDDLISFTATVNGIQPGGNVEFADNGNVIAGCAAVPLVNRLAGCSTANLVATAGASLTVHSIVARYLGDGNHLGSSGSMQQFIRGSSAVLPPGAPLIGAATPGNASALIAFSPPATSSEGGGSSESGGISAYTVSCTAGAASVTASGGSSPVLVTGLSNNTAYACTVKATNGAGTGPASAAVSVTPSASTPLPPVVVPGAPGLTLATPLDGRVKLTFVPPDNNGGAAPNYTATCSAGASTLSASGSASPLYVTGMSNGLTYSCTVKASNSAGAGPASYRIDVTPKSATSC